MPTSKEAGKSKFSFKYSSVLSSVMGISDSPAKYYTYTGSFTTPPCTEGVTFVILDPAAHMMQVSAADIKAMKDIQGTNYRVVSLAVHLNSLCRIQV